MSKIARQHEIKKAPQLPVYTSSDLQQFETFMTKYKIYKTFDDGTTGWWYDDMQFLKDNNALTKDGRVILKNYNYDKGYPSCDCPTQYEILRHKLGCLSTFQRRREYAKKMELSNLAQLADTMQID